MPGAAAPPVRLPQLCPCKLSYLYFDIHYVQYDVSYYKTAICTHKVYIIIWFPLLHVDWWHTCEKGMYLLHIICSCKLVFWWESYSYFCYTKVITFLSLLTRQMNYELLMKYAGFESRLLDAEHTMNWVVHIRTIPTLCDKWHTIINTIDHINGYKGFSSRHFATQSVCMRLGSSNLLHSE